MAACKRRTPPTVLEERRNAVEQMTNGSLTTALNLFCVTICIFWKNNQSILKEIHKHLHVFCWFLVLNFSGGSFFSFQLMGRVDGKLKEFDLTTGDQRMGALASLLRPAWLVPATSGRQYSKGPLVGVITRPGKTRLFF